MSKRLKALCFTGPDTLKLADAEGNQGTGVRKFTQLAYSGEPMHVGGYGVVVVDCAGIRATQKMPMLREHDVERPCGYATKVACTDKVQVEGVILPSLAAGREVCEAADAGMPWQASIRLEHVKCKEISEDETVECNGKTFEGPLTVVVSGVLRESSFVTLGADGQTSSDVLAASAEWSDDKEKQAMPDKETPQPSPKVLKLTVGELEQEQPALFSQVKSEVLRRDRERVAGIRAALDASGIPEAQRGAVFARVAEIELPAAQGEIARVSVIEASLVAAKAAGFTDADLNGMRADTAGCTAASAQAVIKAAVDAKAAVQARLVATADPALTQPTAQATDNLPEEVERVRPLALEAAKVHAGLTNGGDKRAYIRTFVLATSAHNGAKAVELTDAHIDALCK